MTWQCRNVLVSTRFWNQNPPKPVIGPTKYHAKHIYNWCCIELTRKT